MMQRQQKSFRTRADRTERWLQFCFAMLSCLGGLALASGPDTEVIPVIAIFFAVFGFVFVDWLKLFELPPIGAYIAMGVAAIYCVGDFWNLHTTGSQQMIAVALLLVLVQAILMLQRKTPRVFEQLAVFCLLQLVVGAVFNDALNYGLLLIPLALIGGWALSLMSAVAASEGIQTRFLDDNPAASDQLQNDDQGDEQDSASGLLQRISEHWMFRPIGGGQSKPSRVHAWSIDSILSLANAAKRLQRFSLLTLAPSVLLVGTIFFYALPRTTGAARMHNHGRSLVGFSDTVQLDQFGRMLQSSATALRITLTDRNQGKQYMPKQGIYLRGQVLEIYQPRTDREPPTASWRAVPRGPISGHQELPYEYSPRLSSDRNFYDTVDVEVNCVAMQTPSLFAMAPYHGSSLKDVSHAVDRWTIARKYDHQTSYPAIEYEFGTNTFYNGTQSPWLTRATPMGRAISGELAALDRQKAGTFGPTVAPGKDRSASVRQRKYGVDSYERKLTRFDAGSMPQLNQLARDIMGSIPPGERTTVTIARAFERHLAEAGGFQYTLNLDEKVPAGTDPIEHFVSVSRVGHCQFFASALAMMLRSVNIPARLVVGYHTDEYNDLGQYFVARQLHAHAWVEVLVDNDQRAASESIYGQWPSDQHWLRLDPTPSDYRAAGSSGSGLNEVFNLLENAWEKRIVGMDAQRQNGTIVAVNDSPVVDSFANWLQIKIAQVRAGNLGRGTLAGHGSFSWRAALLGVVVAIALLALLRLPVRRWIRRQIGAKSVVAPDKPAIPFYAEALQELSRIGFDRQSHQTPQEFAAHVGTLVDGSDRDRAATGDHEPLAATINTLTNAFYEARYGAKQPADVSKSVQRLRDHVDALVGDPALMKQIVSMKS